ncbi:hypothetical protein AVEN_148367-1 [Araneus ventricosus]|uniref:Uncharacterized protein n=1 Tax=Araneus ventricosus TaxID=182803 RepID=A0A4Y2QI46_ARAVE|nr:hypothetical protein AVEN_148367-1 [Araneus ventricosus]
MRLLRIVCRDVPGDRIEGRGQEWKRTKPQTILIIVFPLALVAATDDIARCHEGGVAAICVFWVGGKFLSCPGGFLEILGCFTFEHQEINDFMGGGRTEEDE